MIDVSSFNHLVTYVLYILRYYNNNNYERNVEQKKKVKFSSNDFDAYTVSCMTFKNASAGKYRNFRFGTYIFSFLFFTIKTDDINNCITYNLNSCYLSRVLISVNTRTGNTRNTVQFIYYFHRVADDIFIGIFPRRQCKRILI